MGYAVDNVDFNPRSREGSDVVSVCNGGVDVEISIRAPARGATYVLVFDERVVMISIRAPARGATGFSEILWFPAEFQSALPRGERRVKEGLTMAHMIFQSALPRGERRAGTQESQHHGDFNPRSREGSDAAENEDRTVLDIFQSALPRGERLVGDMVAAKYSTISIRAPARGATYIYPGEQELFSISIRAPARGATRS